MSGSRPLSRGLGDAGLRHFFLDAGECRFVRFVPRFPYASHVYPLIVRGSRWTHPNRSPLVSHLQHHHERNEGGRLPDCDQVFVYLCTPP